MNKQNQTIINLVKELAKKDYSSRQEFFKYEQKICSELKTTLVRSSEIIKTYQELNKKKQVRTNLFLEQELKKRPIRSLSGVAVVAVLTKPWPCPGHCFYCPLEKGIPKSYLSGEPAVERAKLLKYDPYKQTLKRIEVLKNNNHPVDKIELIVIGGTWSYLPKKYQTWFIKRCFDGANEKKSPPEALRIKNKKISNTLKQAQKLNEKAKHKIIGITLETRPDYITPAEIKRMRQLGCTRVEIGVQAIDDQILKINNRGHGVKEIIQATKLLKNAGFKICYHFMPGLLGSTPKKDLAMFKKLFINSDFQPDMLKIYPCVVTKGSQLYKLFKRKKYKPYTDKQLINLLIKMKLIVPEYVRINRLIRDIPAWQIQGGSKVSNLREFIHQEMKKQKKTCSCIRCQEIKQTEIKLSNLKLFEKKYNASDGQEIFLSFKDSPPHQKLNNGGKLVAFLRLRLPNFQVKPANMPEVLKNAALIRELHTYGQLVEIRPVKSCEGSSSMAKFNRVKKINRKAVQHLGLGKKLMAKAEKIAKRQGYKKIAVISGIGVRDYYRHLGYRLQNTYMVKSLENENMKNSAMSRPSQIH